MKKSTLLLLVVLGAFCAMFVHQQRSGIAQSADIEHQKRIDRDKKVPQEKVDLAFVEAKKIQDDIVAVMAKKKPEFKLNRRLSNYSVNTPPGRRGETLDELAWRDKETSLQIHVHLALSQDDALTSMRRRSEYISMGEFFPIPNVGVEAVLVKNVLFNKKVSAVGIHFVKNRAEVDIYLRNHSRKLETNEKEIMEILRLIEPQIVPKVSFYE